MTLKELSKSYKEAAAPIQQRIKELNQKLRESSDKEEIWHLKRRVAELQPLLTEMNALSWLLEHYYEIGDGDRDHRYGFNGKSKRRKGKQKNEEDVAPGLKRRIDRLAACRLSGLSLSDEISHSDGPGAGSEQEHYFQDFEKSGAEGEQDHQVLHDVSSLLASPHQRHWRHTHNE